MERFFILVTYCEGYYFATKSSFVEWLIFQNDNCTTLRCDPLVARESMKNILAFIEHILWELISNQKHIVEWRWKTGANVREQYRFVVLRLVVMLCLVRLNFGGYGNLISHVLDKKYIIEQLPRGFCNILKGGNKNVNVFKYICKNANEGFVLLSIVVVCPLAVRLWLFFPVEFMNGTSDDVLAAGLLQLADPSLSSNLFFKHVSYLLFLKMQLQIVRKNLKPQR
ncbi:hypothetical protein ACFE04_027622 [Oxalis oulophora]